MDKWNTLAPDEQIEKTITALKKNNIEAMVVENGEEAKKKVLEIVPKGVNVGVNTSITLDTIGVSDVIDNSGEYDSQRKKWLSLDMKMQSRELEILRSTPEWVLGSAHAVTSEGIIMIASNSGSNLPSVSYAARHVILVIGAQKLVATMDDGMKRIFEYSLPLETVRARKAYGLPDTWNSYPSRVLLLNRESTPGRTQVIIVKEILGF